MKRKTVVWILSGCLTGALVCCGSGGLVVSRLIEAEFQRQVRGAVWGGTPGDGATALLTRGEEREPRLRVETTDEGLHLGVSLRGLRLEEAATAILVEPGLLVTCYHNLRTPGGEKLLIYEDGTRSRITTVLAWDSVKDVVVLGLREDEVPLRVLVPAESMPQVGDPVRVSGFLDGRFHAARGVFEGQWTIEGRPSLITVRAAVGPGMSGGPVLDVSGRLIGMHFASYDAGVSHHSGRFGIGLPIGELRPLLAEATDRRARRTGIPLQDWREGAGLRNIDDLDMALVSIQQGDHADASNVVEGHLKERTDDPKGLWLLAACRFAQGEPREARRLMSLALERGASGMEMEGWNGRLLEDEGNDEEAMQAYLRCIGKEGRTLATWELWVVVDALGRLARLQERTGNREEAIRTYRRLEALVPYDPFVPARIGENHYILGRLKEAAPEFARCTAVEREVAGFWARRAVVALGLGDLPAVKDHGRRAVALDPGLAYGWLLLGAAAARSGDEALKKEALEKLGATDPSLIPTLEAVPRDGGRGGVPWPTFFEHDGGIRVNRQK